MSNQPIIPQFITPEPQEPSLTNSALITNSLANHDSTVIDTNNRGSENVHTRTTSNTSTILSSVNDPTNTQKVHFFSRPFLAPLIFDNTTSEARDLDAAERNFLSWIRLAMVLAVSGTAVIINLRFMDFGSKTHGKYYFSSAPSFDDISTNNMEQLNSWENLLHIVSSNSINTRFSMPLGIIFYILSILCLLSAVVTYISSVNGYVSQYIVVTNSLSVLVLVSVIALVIIAANILLLTQGSFKT